MLWPCLNWPHSPTVGVRQCSFYVMLLSGNNYYASCSVMFVRSIRNSFCPVYVLNDIRSGKSSVALFGDVRFSVRPSAAGSVQSHWAHDVVSINLC